MRHAGRLAWANPEKQLFDPIHFKPASAREMGAPQGWRAHRVARLCARRGQFAQTNHRASPQWCLLSENI